MKPIIIIPALNPNRYLVNTVQKLKESGYHIVVVDDGSNQKHKYIFDTLINEYFCDVVKHNNNKGKGVALKTGMEYIKNRYPVATGFVTADADGQHTVEDIIRVALSLEYHKNSIILGTRQFRLGEIPIRSFFGNKITSFVYLLSSGNKCPDTQTGLRGMPMSLLEKCLKINGSHYEYEMNMLIELGRQKEKFIYLPIETVYMNDNAESHFRPVRDSLSIYMNIFKYSISSILSAIIDLLIFTLFIRIGFGLQANGIFIATVIARLISGNFNFFMNKLWVFQSKQNYKKESGSYFLLFISQMLLSWTFVFLLQNLFGNITIVKMLVDSALFVISYMIQKKFVFSRLHKETLA